MNTNAMERLIEIDKNIKEVMRSFDSDTQSLIAIATGDIFSEATKIMPYNENQYLCMASGLRGYSVSIEKDYKELINTIEYTDKFGNVITDDMEKIYDCILNDSIGCIYLNINNSTLVPEGYILKMKVI